MILLYKALYRAFAVFVQSSLQVVCHAGVQDSISFVGQKVDIILFHALTAFLGVEFAEAFLLSERVLRDCHVASLLAMTNRGASTVLTAAGTDRGVPSRDCHVASLLAMTNLGACFTRRGARASLRVPPSRVIPRSEATWESQAGTYDFAGAFLCSGVYCEIATAPAEPRNDKLGGLFRSKERNDKAGRLARFSYSSPVSSVLEIASTPMTRLPSSMRMRMTPWVSRP